MASETVDGGVENHRDASWAALGAASREKADAFLDEQTRLTRLQAEDLTREDQLRHWSLRVHHVSDVMKLAFELAVALILIAIVVAIGGAIWTAAHDKSLVIEAFSVPPDMAARGITGAVVASQIQDKLAAMQDATVSTRPAASYSNNLGANDIKVEIPNTGVSIGELYRYLAGWLGDQTHITGEIYRTPSGIAVTARVSGQGSGTAAGTEAGLDTLLQKAAETVYRQTQPYRYAVYLQDQGLANYPASRRILTGLTLDADARERAWAFVALGNMDNFSGNFQLAGADYRNALTAMPDFALGRINLSSEEGQLGHDEEALALSRTAVDLLSNGDGGLSARARPVHLLEQQQNIAFTTNDFADVERIARATLTLPEFTQSHDSAREAIINAFALRHDEPGLRRYLAHEYPSSSDLQTTALHSLDLMIADYWLGRWPEVIRQHNITMPLLTTLTRSVGATSAFSDAMTSTQVRPYLATARAMTGDIEGARALINTTPLDCFTCVRNRGDIAAAAHDWRAANYWFARTTTLGPSIPIGYSDWGRVLLMQGDLTDAIDKFTLANQKGPHFADPLEMWGEALVRQNRADLALAKFADADKYAPNWGRLHLKWGEALLWLGRKDEAHTQLAAAAQLSLTPAERAELGRLRS